MNLKRIAHLYTGNLFGGLENVLLQLDFHKKYLNEIDQHFILFFDGLLAQKLRDQGAILKIVGDSPSFKKPFSIINAAYQLKSYIQEARIDLLICHEFWAYSIAAPILSFCKIPRIIWHHSSGKNYYLRSILKYFPAHLAINCSHYILKELSDLTPIHKSVVVYPPHLPWRKNDSTIRAKIRSDNNIKADDIVLLHVGRMSSYKGQKDLLLAARHIQGFPIKIWIVGGVQQPKEELFLNELKEIIYKNKLDVVFFGFQSDVKPFYFGADIFCHPNLEAEPFGLGFIEALLSGLPIIATNIGGAKEILTSNERQFGELVPPHHIPSLSSSLENLIKNKELRNKYSLIGPKRAEELCDPETTMQHLYKVLTSFAISY